MRGSHIHNYRGMPISHPTPVNQKKLSDTDQGAKKFKYLLFQ